jgi:DNA-binding NarL/FixJ family response regulator
MEVVGEASGGWEAVRQTRACQPDVVVMDVSMADLNGTEATEQIKQAYPGVQVLVLTRHGDQGYVSRMLHAGASGYILKKTAPDELIEAIRTVAAGDTYFDPALMKELMEDFNRRPAPLESDPSREELTKREAEVLHLVAWGKSNKEIASQLGLSVKTVEYYKANAVGKLGLYSRTDILRYALAQGWLQEDEEPE